MCTSVPFETIDTTMENKHESSISKQEPDLLDLDGVELAKSLAKIPFYFCEVSPLGNSLHIQRNVELRLKQHCCLTPPPLEGKDNGIDEEFKKSPICVTNDYKFSTQPTSPKSSSQPQPQQLQSTATCNTVPISLIATEISPSKINHPSGIALTSV
ncbi:hypothetical protein Hanom_Chr01g00085471 [Helianthus anomalus]